MQTVIACVLAAALWGQASAEALPPSDTPPQTAPQRKDQLEEFARDAAAYEMLLQAPQPVRLTLFPRPILNWDGSAFVWLKDGRPEVIGTLWSQFIVRTGQLKYAHAFHSLSEYPLAAHLHSQLIWSPKTPGLQFKPVPGCDAPAAEARTRLVQIKSLAREFSAVQWKAGRAELRMLTQPIFRYEPTAGRTKDGAIFAFTNTQFGTDPDALLLLEARESDDKFRWEYAFARFHFVELSGLHRDKEVWRVADAWAQRKQHRFAADPGRDSIYYSVLRP